MALNPIDGVHALQIQAGILGRKTGHGFEDRIAQEINSMAYPRHVPKAEVGHVFTGDPAIMLVDYIAKTYRKSVVKGVLAISTGALATSEEGLHWLNINGVTVRKCKSDLVLTFEWEHGDAATVGVSTKQCNTKKPTNAQLFFTTAVAFSNLLIRNGLPVSTKAIISLRQFCGDVGYRPMDNAEWLRGRVSDPRRWFWEEINADGRREWENILSTKQDEVSRLLYQKAYLDDPFAPDFLLHKTRLSTSWNATEIAVYGIDELIRLSSAYGGFSKKAYSVNKVSHIDPPGVRHDAPRFGIIQMQRGGQAQHPTQLQFNLEARYFYRIS